MKRRCSYEEEEKKKKKTPGLTPTLNIDDNMSMADDDQRTHTMRNLTHVSQAHSQSCEILPLTGVIGGHRPCLLRAKMEDIIDVSDTCQYAIVQIHRKIE